MKYGISKKHLADIQKVLGRFPHVERGILLNVPDKGRRYHKYGLVKLAVEGKVDWAEGGVIELYFKEVSRLPYYFEVFDPHRVQSNKLSKRVKEYGVVIYEKKPRLGRPLKPFYR